MLQTDDADGGGWGAQLWPKTKVPVTSAKFSQWCCMSWQAASACQPDPFWRLQESCQHSTHVQAHPAGNVFARKSHRLDSSSELSPGAHFDSPQLPWWNSSGSGTGPVSNAAQRALSASSEDIDGTAKMAELQLYHNDDGQAALLGRGGFGQVSAQL
jgi:hypothetical protein